jgi:hypothetical protein
MFGLTGGDVTADGSLLRIHPGGQSDSSEVHASNDPKLAHSPANASGHCFGCRHEVIPNVDQYPGDLLVRESGPRMVCNKCCVVGADVRPNWKERNK